MRNKKIEFICPSCKSAFLRHVSTVRPGGKAFCSRACYGVHLKTAFIGEGNPRFQKEWTDAQKQKVSKGLKRHFESEEARFIAGTSNRGKKFSKERILKMHGHRPPGSYSRPVSDKRRLEIGEESSARWKDDNYKNNITSKGRATKEKKGLITPQSQLTPWKIYWSRAGWKASFKYTQEKDLLKRGLCRDHIVGRKQGFLLGIFPEILQHPENCQIISLSDNAKKARKEADASAPAALFERIENYCGNYPDHHKTIILISKYKLGERWIKD